MLNRFLLPTLVLLLTASAAAQSLVNGGSVTGSITSANQRKTYTFAANAGESFKIRMVDTAATTFYPVVELFDPKGNSVQRRGAYDVAGLSGTTALTGTYKVVVRDGNTQPQTGSYRIYFTLAPGANEGGLLKNGSYVAGKIDRGDLDSFTFPITAGESYQLRFVDSNATTLYPVVTLYDPRGAVVAAKGDYDVAALAGAAKYTGTYTVVVNDGNTDPLHTGSYRLYFVRVPGANKGGSLPNGGSVNGAIERGELDSFTFPITAGQSYLLRLADLGATALYPTLRLFDPRGCLVASHGNYDVARLSGTAQHTGTYTVIVADGNTSPQRTGSYRLHFVRAPGANSGGALPNGRPVSGTVQLGELHSYTFAIDAGQAYHLRLVDRVGTTLYPTLILFDPRGTRIGIRGGYEVASLAGTAPLTGTYTVVVLDGTTGAAATGAFDLQLVRAPGAARDGVLRSGGALSGAIGRGELDTYRFTFRAGDSYVIRLADRNGTNLYPTMWLYDPRGTRVASKGAHDVASLSGQAVFAGTYTLVVGDGNTSPHQTGAYDLHFAAISGANEHGYLLNGRGTANRIDRGDIDTFTFRAKAGDPAKITVTDTAKGPLLPRINLYGPSGAFLATAYGATTAVLNRVIKRDGTHTIVVLDANTGAAGTGAYSISLTGSGVAGNPGCSLEGPSLLSGAPSAKTGFTIKPPTFSRTCTGPKIVVVGPCAPKTILLPSSLSCGTCGLVVPSAWILAVNQVVVPPLSSSTVGLTFCAQSGCDTGSCLTLSDGLRITIEK